MPANRWLIALACAGLLLVGCGRSTDGVLIGIRAHTEVASVVATFDPSTITAEIDAQLAESDQLTPIHDSVGGELPLDSTLTPKQRERLATDQQVGFAYVADRLAALASVRGQVVSDPSMQDWQKANLLALLDGASSSLRQIQLKIERDLLVYQARTDKARVLRLRVDSLLIPQARLLITGYLLQRLAVVYAHQKASLQQMVYAAQASGKDVTAAQAAVTDMATRISAINQRSAAGLALLQGLTPAGYPGNKGQLLSARSLLTSGKYAGDQAANDVARARAALGL